MDVISSDIAQFYRDVPRGAYIYPNSEYLYASQRKDHAERALHNLAYVCGISPVDIYRIERAARKWYESTKWELCLPDHVANRLVAYFAK